MIYWFSRISIFSVADISAADFSRFISFILPSYKVTKAGTK